MPVKLSRKKQVDIGSANPFVRPVEHVEAEPDLDSSPIMGDKETLAGASTDTPHQQGRLVLVGTGGGVGVSTIRSHCQGPIHESDFAELEATDNAVLVATVSYTSLQQAEAMILGLKDAEAALVGLVLVHHRRNEDIPATTKTYGKRIARLCPRTFEVRFEKTWPDQPLEDRKPSRFHRRRFRTLIKTLDQWIQTNHTTGENT